jgi:hypothetical protein
MSILQPVRLQGRTPRSCPGGLKSILNWSTTSATSFGGKSRPSWPIEVVAKTKGQNGELNASRTEAAQTITVADNRPLGGNAGCLPSRAAYEQSIRVATLGVAAHEAFREGARRGPVARTRSICAGDQLDPGQAPETGPVAQSGARPGEERGGRGAFRRRRPRPRCRAAWAVPGFTITRTATGGRQAPSARRRLWPSLQRSRRSSVWCR